MDSSRLIGKLKKKKKKKLSLALGSQQMVDLRSLSKHRVRACPETSSHATCQETFGHGRLSSLSHCGLILAQKEWN